LLRVIDNRIASAIRQAHDSKDADIERQQREQYRRERDEAE
jgi:hypothetical protein